MLTVDLPKLVEFFDVDRDVKSHASSVKGVMAEELILGLAMHCLASKFDHVERLDCAATTKGNWLDAWLRCKTAGQADIYYQTEVKSWSFHGYTRGAALPLEVTTEQYLSHSRNAWNDYWDSAAERFKAKQLDKVLKRMDQFPKERVEPFACVWASIHPSGAQTAFFIHPRQKSGFSSVTVFSASAYVRGLIARGVHQLPLHLDRTERRLQIANALFL